jgi:hypothetical protein
MLKVLKVVLAIAGASMVGSPPATATVTLVQDDPWAIAVRNDDGEWWLLKTCINSAQFRAAGYSDPPYGPGLTTGPGYVYYMVAPNGEVLIDDWGKPVITEDGTDSKGGFGSFAYHVARGNPYFYFDGNNAWSTGTRICAEDMGGHGVARAWVSEGPTKYGGGPSDPLYWSIYVDLKTPSTDPFIRILYRYQFHNSTIKLWTRVFNMCAGFANSDACGDPGAFQFVKEPKFIAETNPAANFSRACGFDRDGSVSSGWRNPFLGGDPNVVTGQITDPGRARVRFDHGGMDCSYSACPCLNVVGRSYPAGTEPNGPTSAWMGAQRGLDWWADRANYYGQMAHWNDGSASTPYWDCHSGSPAAAANRSWELTGSGWSRWPMAAYLLGWKGGKGAYDCEPLARTMAGWSDVANHFQFSLGAGFEFE